MSGLNDWLHFPCTYNKNLPVVRKQFKSFRDQFSEKDNMSVGLLVGDNYEKDLEPTHIILSKVSQLYAFKTKPG